MLRTDQTVNSSVTSARVVTVSGVTSTFLVCSHAFGYVSLEGWDRHRLVEVLAEVPRLNVQSGHSKVLHQDRAVLRWGPHP